MNASELLADRARLFRAGGPFDAQGSMDVPSPCISVCRMTPDRSHCQGCFRTLDEIREWSQASNARRRVIWAALLERANNAQEARP
ncbi:MAG: DUF1289 domain-containing protein [Acidovorax sp.]